MIRKVTTGMSARKGRSEKVYPLMNTTGKLATMDKKKAEVLNKFFASVFTGTLFSHTS